MESRGWTKGSKRSHTDEEERRIIILKKSRVKSKYFVGAPYVRMDYTKKFPRDPLPSEWFVKEVTRRAKLQTREPKKRSRGKNIVARLLFPVRSIVGLGKIQQSCDFIGKKYIMGSKEPVNVFSTSFYQWFELYQIWRVLAETSEQAIAKLAGFWKIFPLPHVMRMDNGMAFRGTGRTAVRIGRFLKFLLNLGIIPLFSAARQSYTNPHIEGHNRTFTEKLWARNFFTSLDDIDAECAKFNAESREFFEWKFGERLNGAGIRRLAEDSVPDADILRSTKGKKICFIRFVECWKERNGTAGIVVLDRFVEIPRAYVGQYVFATLSLETATIDVISEYRGTASKVISRPFTFTA